ncbi:hypothetical protein BB561_004164 [Smittium simulii]|uniref:SAP domain-containing protein n=1 Tax=Smittium simulii TaxID=133385 RepID=A0A2T9YHV0_9FUNG|nr:hypothetical protein BB561_004164 [Smittium simulii]
MNQYSEKNLKKLKVNELRQILLEHNLPAEGKKDELITKLLQLSSQEPTISTTHHQSSTTSNEDPPKISSTMSLSEKETEPTIIPQQDGTTTSSLNKLTEKVSSQEPVHSSNSSTTAINSTETKSLDDVERLNLRAKKFGLADNSVVDENQKKLMRLHKFGPVAEKPNTGSSKPEIISNKPAANTTDLEILKKRAMRFGLPIKNSNSINTEADDKVAIKRLKKFGDTSSISSANNLESMSSSDKELLAKRAQRFGLA